MGLSTHTQQPQGRCLEQHNRGLPEPFRLACADRSAYQNASMHGQEAIDDGRGLFEKSALAMCERGYANLFWILWRALFRHLAGGDHRRRGQLRPPPPRRWTIYVRLSKGHGGVPTELRRRYAHPHSARLAPYQPQVDVIQMYEQQSGKALDDSASWLVHRDPLHGNAARQAARSAAIMRAYSSHPRLQGTQPVRVH